jgi:formylmethanofuran dehydrogenase subunit E
MKNKIVRIVSPILMLALMLTLVAGAVAQEKFVLTPIVLEDAGEKIEISIDDIAKYHGHLCPCSGIAFRAARFGISKLWGSEISKREDIKIISSLPTPGSADCFSYITGTGPAVPHKSEGEFNLILPDGTEVTNYSPKNLKPISKDMTIDNWNFVIVRKSTGERFEVWVKEDVFSENLFFELRRKVKFTKTVTNEEKKQFQSMKGKIVDKVKTQPDGKLFEGKLIAKGPTGAIYESTQMLECAAKRLHNYVQVLMTLVKEPEKNKLKIQAVVDETDKYVVEKIEDYIIRFHDAAHKLIAADGGPQAEVLHDYAHELGYLIRYIEEYVQVLLPLVKEPEKNKAKIQATADDIYKYVEEFEELVENINELLEKL